MTLADAMHPSPTTCGPSATVEQVARLMTQNEIGSIVVVDEERRPIGIVTDRDLVSRVLSTGREADTPISEVMTADPVTVVSTTDMAHAIEQLGVRECRRLPVVEPENRRLVGVVTLDDALLSAVRQTEAIARVISSERRPDARDVL